MFGKEGEKEGGWKLMDAGMELSGPEKKNLFRVGK